MQTIEGKQAQDIAVGDKIRTYTYAGWTTETVLEVEVEQVTEQELKWWPAGRIAIVTDGHADCVCTLFHPTDVIRMAA
jgi:hypothetical protein